MKMAKTARPRMRPPLPFSKEGEGGKQLVGDFGAGDEQQADAGSEQDQHVNVAK
jgi:hypothetical protein